MIESHPQEALLIRYADSNASSLERTEVERLVEFDETAKQFLLQLNDTQLPYADAFDRLLPRDLNSVPQAVIDSLEMSVPPPSRWFGKVAMLSVLLLGGFAGWLTSSVWQSPFGGERQSVTASVQPPEWIRLVADYHSLYVRDTLTASAPESVKDTSIHLSGVLNREITIPTLAEFDIQFRRSQMLAVGDAPLVQLTYLPGLHKPIAICLLKRRNQEGAADPSLITGSHASMNYVHWQDAGHEVVVVGEVSAELLEGIAETVRRSLFKS